MWIQRKLFNKIAENLNFDLFGGPKWPKNWDLWGPYLQKYLQWAYNSSFKWIKWKLFKKIEENLFCPYLGKKGPKNLAHTGHFSHPPESTNNMPVNHFHSSKF